MNIYYTDDGNSVFKNISTLDGVSGTGEDGAERSGYLLLPLSTSMSSYGFSFDGGSLKTMYTTIMSKTPNKAFQ